MPPTYDLVQHVPPPVDLQPTLRLVMRKPAGRSRTAKYRAYLSQGIIERLGLRDGQAANILPPNNSEYWYLDLRPVAPRRIKRYADTRPRIPCLDLPAGLVLPGHPITLKLVPGEPPFPGFYLLQLDANPTPKQAPPLAA
jgi:hypothetical protein